jgi:long-chain acyl-CoA synthetase
MTFLETIFGRLERAADEPVLGEARDGAIVPVTGGDLLAMIAQARGFIAARGWKAGDRCALLGPNSIRWVALDLALMAEGVIVVPLDPRQVAKDWLGVINDSTPVAVCCADGALAGQVRAAGKADVALFEEIFSREPGENAFPRHHADHDAVTIVYTSGTSGEPKGVVLTAGNITFMLGCTNARLNQLMDGQAQQESVFQYAPFCFAAARILLFTSLSRHTMLTLSTDLLKLADELKVAAPHYFVNVPMFLERVRKRVEESIEKRGGLAAGLFRAARAGYYRQRNGETRPGGLLALWLASKLMFPAIRANIGPNLKALICGSAPLSEDTQLFFMMIGIPVLQVYGLTETTAICTMDEPGKVEPGRVGRAVPGIEMTAGANGEILVRGPNVFPGYWRRPAETAKALEGGWFHTGDQGEADATGNWKITGRLKNLIILNSGHNIAPEPLEHQLAGALPEAQQVVLLGNQRSFLAALLTPAPAANGGRPTWPPAANGDSGLAPAKIQAALDAMNAGLPHYKQIRAFRVLPEAFTMENGMLTTMGKLKRDAIAARYAAEIDSLYRKKPA